MAGIPAGLLALGAGLGQAVQNYQQQQQQAQRQQMLQQQLKQQQQQQQAAQLLGSLDLSSILGGGAGVQPVGGAPQGGGVGVPIPQSAPPPAAPPPRSRTPGVANNPFYSNGVYQGAGARPDAGGGAAPLMSPVPGTEGDTIPLDAPDTGAAAAPQPRAANTSPAAAPSAETSG